MKAVVLNLFDSKAPHCPQQYLNFMLCYFTGLNSKMHIHDKMPILMLVLRPRWKFAKVPRLPV